MFEEGKDEIITKSNRVSTLIEDYFHKAQSAYKLSLSKYNEIQSKLEDVALKHKKYSDELVGKLNLYFPDIDFEAKSTFMNADKTLNQLTHERETLLKGLTKASKEAGENEILMSKISKIKKTECSNMNELQLIRLLNHLMGKEDNCDNFNGGVIKADEFRDNYKYGTTVVFVDGDQMQNIRSAEYPDICFRIYKNKSQAAKIVTKNVVVKECEVRVELSDFYMVYDFMHMIMEEYRNDINYILLTNDKWLLNLSEISKLRPCNFKVVNTTGELYEFLKNARLSVSDL